MAKAYAKGSSAGVTEADVLPSPLDPLPPGERNKRPGTTANDANKPQSISSVNLRQPITYKQYSAAGAAKTQWVRAIAEMTAVIKTQHYSAKTLKSYGHWIWKFQRFKKDTYPVSLTTEDVKAFLSWLAVTCNVSASSQN